MEHAVQLPFTVFLYSPFPDNYAFLSLSPSQIKNIQSADTVPVHGHSPLVWDRVKVWIESRTGVILNLSPLEHILGYQKTDNFLPINVIILAVKTYVYFIIFDHVTLTEVKG